ncbi:MAG: hypothetical protein LLF94_06535 [Chlamydiales bacterium]|nr:hypothetical protein [Chlamydiales bacterium]
MTTFDAISKKAIAADTAWQNEQINELDLKNVISLLDQEINELKSQIPKEEYKKLKLQCDGLKWHVSLANPQHQIQVMRDLGKSIVTVVEKIFQ